VCGGVAIEAACGTASITRWGTGRGARLAVFIDSCFWRGCPDQGSRLLSNVHYWLPKIEALDGAAEFLVGEEYPGS
jgi:hypothetical protein